MEAIDLINALVLLTNFVILPATTYGSQLALGALGITLIYSILRFGNFAHGDTMSLGTIFTIFFTWLFIYWGVQLGPIPYILPVQLPTALLALPFGILVTIGLVIFTDKIIFRYFRVQRVPPIMLTIVSVGVMFVYAGLVRFLIGTNEQSFNDGDKWIWKTRTFKKYFELNEGVGLKVSQGLTIVIAVLVVIAVFWFLNRTKTGKSMRAYSDNEDLALLSGINPDRVVMITWILGATLATIAGVLFGLDKSFKPFTYFQLLLPMFAAAIVGGVGQPVGAIVGGYVIAFSEVLVTYAYKKFLKYLLPEGLEPTTLMQFLGTEYKFAVSFILLVLVLLIRPTGIFRGKVI